MRGGTAEGQPQVTGPQVKYMYTELLQISPIKRIYSLWGHMLPFLVSYHPPISRQTRIKFTMATSAFVHFIIYYISYKTEAGFKGRHFWQLFPI
jgi:hypothetical protein